MTFPVNKQLNFSITFQLFLVVFHGQTHFSNDFPVQLALLERFLSGFVHPKAKSWEKSGVSKGVSS